MRRDNPHISKRRGGRKTSHRKFSLQAFHAHRQQQQQPAHLQAPSSSAGSSSAKSLVETQRLPLLLESQSELSGGGGGEKLRDPTEVNSREELSVARSEPPTGSGGGRRVRMESGSSSTVVAPADRGDIRQNHSRPHSHHHHHHHHHHRRHQHAQQQQQHNECATKAPSLVGWPATATTTGRNLVSADPNSTGSGGGVYFDYDENIIMNDSQSSENVSPQRRSSFVCSQSSIHPDDSSLN